MDVEEISSELSWRDFEGLVSEILRDNGFRISRNFRFKTGRRYEIDIIAIRDKNVLCIDCKQWRGGRSKRGALIGAVREQEKRTSELEKFLRKNPDDRVGIILNNAIKFYPMIATLMQEDVIKEGDTFVVPVSKFNSFILEMEKYL